MLSPKRSLHPAGLVVTPFGATETCDNEGVMASNQRPLTDARKKAFLEELELHGVIARAARAASTHSKTGCVQSFYDERVRDEVFGTAWDDAVAQAMGSIEHEIHRRGVEGWEEPVFAGRYREKIVGTVRKYSDRLLELRARALIPAYRDQRKLEVEASVADVRRKAAEDEQAAKDALEAMSPEDRDQFLDLLNKGSDDD